VGINEEARATAINITKEKMHKDSGWWGERNHTEGDKAHVNFKTMYSKMKKRNISKQLPIIFHYLCSEIIRKVKRLT
jgi:hypothetical protein